MILIEPPRASRSRIHHKPQRAVRYFGRMVNYCLLREYCSAPYIDRYRTESWVDANGISGYSLTGPEVVPDPTGKFHVIGAHKLVHFGRNQQVRAEHEFRIDGLKVLLIGKFKKHGAHQGDANARSLFHAAVDIGQQLVSQFDVAAADGLMFGPVDPGFAVAAAFHAMVAVDG